MANFLDETGLSRLWTKVKSIFLLQSERITSEDIDDTLLSPVIVIIDSAIQVNGSDLMFRPITPADPSYDGEISQGDYIGLYFANPAYDATNATRYAVTDVAGIWDYSYDKYSTPIPEDLLNITYDYLYIFEAEDNNNHIGFSYVGKKVAS